MVDRPASIFSWFSLTFSSFKRILLILVSVMDPMARDSMGGVLTPGDVMSEAGDMQEDGVGLDLSPPDIFLLRLYLLMKSVELREVITPASSATS